MIKECRVAGKGVRGIIAKPCMCLHVIIISCKKLRTFQHVTIVSSHERCWQMRVVFSHPVYAKVVCSMKPSMTIAFSVNHRFLMLCLSAIASILYNAEGEDTFHFIILHSELSEDDLNYFKKLKKLRPFDLSIRKIDYNRFASFPLVWTTQETWYRCLLADLFPQESRILYLDSDVIVRKSLSPLWEIDLGTDLVAGVEDIVLSRYNSKLLGLKQNYYINAGVLLINAYQWRKERLLQAIELYVKNHCCPAKHIELIS